MGVFNYLCKNYGEYTSAGHVCDDGLSGAEFKEYEYVE